MSRRADCEAIVKAAEQRFGGIDILVNNAGIMDRFMPVGELTDELWERVLSVNLSGPMYMTRAALPGMLAKKRGAIVADGGWMAF